MYVCNIKHLPEKVFLSLSDETKIKMATNQLFINCDNSDEYDEVFEWLCDNTLQPFYIIKEPQPDNKEIRSWIFFYDDIDLAGFKLRWA